MGKLCTRANDERFVEMLDRRASDESCASIAQDMGITKNAVSNLTVRIRKADEAHDPEDFAANPGYWT